MIHAYGVFKSETSAPDPAAGFALLIGLSRNTLTPARPGLQPHFQHRTPLSHSSSTTHPSADPVLPCQSPTITGVPGNPAGKGPTVGALVGTHLAMLAWLRRPTPRVHM